MLKIPVQSHIDDLDSAEELIDFITMVEQDPTVMEAEDYHIVLSCLKNKIGLEVDFHGTLSCDDEFCTILEDDNQHCKITFDPNKIVFTFAQNQEFLALMSKFVDLMDMEEDQELSARNEVREYDD
jgi:hypothetical protein